MKSVITALLYKRLTKYTKFALVVDWKWKMANADVFPLPGPSTRKQGKPVNSTQQNIILNVANYTYLQNKRMRRCGVPPPPHQQFSKDLSYPNKLYIVGKRIYRRVRIIKNIGKIFWFRDFMSNFREIGGI